MFGELKYELLEKTTIGDCKYELRESSSGKKAIWIYTSWFDKWTPYTRVNIDECWNMIKNFNHYK